MKPALRRPLLILAALVCMGAASDPAERLADPAAEARARSLFKEVRCMVCQGESIDDSEAPLAADLRRTVREQIVKGSSDQQVRAYLTSRYGQFVLLKPSFSLSNALLWLGPFVLVLIGIGGLIGLSRRREPADTTLSAEEKRRLKSLTDE
jgi:cytochrome c-type biogenesis protein CcmH